MAKSDHKKREPRIGPKKLSPQLWKGMRVGLLGGSFNPPHAGHAHASEVAKKYLGLDAVWWLVSPGNPLKNNSGLPDLELRIESCNELNSDPRVIISGIEKEFGTRRSLDTIAALKKYFPQTEFVWLAGTDISFEIHRWHRWKSLVSELPLAFIGRPTKSGLVRKNAIRNLPLKHMVPSHGIKPLLKAGTVFWLFAEPLNSLSSTLLREKPWFAPKRRKV